MFGRLICFSLPFYADEFNIFVLNEAGIFIIILSIRRISVSLWRINFPKSRAFSYKRRFLKSGLNMK